MSLSNSLRLLFMDFSGYFIYRKTDLPAGVDLKEDLINKFSLDPKYIFDVGANYGQTAIHFNKLFASALIFSFEPVKESFSKLVANTKGLNNISCFNIALGEDNKEQEILLFNEANSQLNSLKTINSNQNDEAVKENIKVMTLNDFSEKQKITQIDLLKIDTEGFELEVLKGSVDFLKTTKIRAVLCEVALSKRNKRNTQLIDIMNFLDTYDYFFVGLYETNVNYYKEGLAYSNALFIKKNI